MRHVFGERLLLISEHREHLLNLALDAPHHINRRAGRTPFLRALPGVPAPLESLDREPLIIAHPLDLEEGLDVLGRVLPLTAAGLLGAQKSEFRLPKPQYVGGKAGQPADLADLVKEFLADRCAGFSGS